MDAGSRLEGNSICVDCDKMITALEKEITEYKCKIKALEGFGNLDISGESVTALKARNSDLICIINKMIEADELDIKDYKVLQEHVRNVYIIGAEVIENLRKARQLADACYDTATSLWNAAESAYFPIEAEVLRALSNASRKAGDGWERIYAYWKGQEYLYDSIDCSTSKLFLEGLVMQKEAHTLMMSFSQSKIPFDPVKMIKKNKPISGRPISTLEKQIKYLEENGFEDEEINFLYNEYPGLVSSLFATINFSSPDASKILKQMREHTKKTNKGSAFGLGDIVAYQYCAVANARDVTIDLSDKKYENMLNERKKHSHGWFAYEWISGMDDLKNYYRVVNCEYEEKGDHIIVNERLEVFEKNGYLVNQEGRYLVTVGPLVLNPNFFDNSSTLQFADFEQYLGCDIDVVLVNDSNPNDVITVECTYGGDIKAHTDGWGEGICMSGERYPMAKGAGPEHATPDGSFIEFWASPTDTGSMSNYSVVKIIVRQMQGD